MAIYHQSVKPVQRSHGRSSTAAAAYRSGERIRDEREGRTHDYTRRSGIEHAETVGWSGSRSELWNAAEHAERRKDGTTAREYEVGLPRELSRDGREQLARDYAGWLHERHGVAVDVAIHDHDKANPHAHLLATTRQVGADGRSLGDKAAVEWSDKKRKQHGLPGRKSELKAAREAWQEHANRALGRDGHNERIDHRSLAAQREEAQRSGEQQRADALDREPQTKVGHAAQRMEAAGHESDRGREHRARKQRNEQRRGLYERAREVGEQLQHARDVLAENMQRGVKAAHERFNARQQRMARGLEAARQRYNAHVQERAAEQQRAKEQQRQAMLDRWKERTQDKGRDGPTLEM